MFTVGDEEGEMVDRGGAGGGEGRRRDRDVVS